MNTRTDLAMVHYPQDACMVYLRALGRFFWLVGLARGQKHVDFVCPQKRAFFTSARINYIFMGMFELWQKDVKGFKEHIVSIHCEQVVNFIIPSQLSKNMICVNNIFAYEKIIQFLLWLQGANKNFPNNYIRYQKHSKKLLNPSMGIKP